MGEKKKGHVLDGIEWSINHFAGRSKRLNSLTSPPPQEHLQSLRARKRSVSGEGMASKVAIVKLQRDSVKALRKAFKLIGGIDDLNKKKRVVTIKPGIFDHTKENHPTVNLVGSIAKSFSKASKILVVESDNYKGTGSERLRIYSKVFSRRVVPFNLSEDSETREVEIADEKMALSHVLFKPNVLVSVHVLRSFEKGSVLKNLFGLVPDRKKARFHKKLEAVILDIYEAVGGIDLAVLDGTHLYSGPSSSSGVKAGFVLVGRDAVAVEAAGAVLTGMDPRKMPIVMQAMRRNLGEGDADQIEVVGQSLEDIRKEMKR